MDIVYTPIKIQVGGGSPCNGIATLQVKGLGTMYSIHWCQLCIPLT